MPKIEIRDGLHYACAGCGLCCRRGFSIDCTPEERARIEGTAPLVSRPEVAGRRLFVRSGDAFRLAADNAGRCRFLLPDERCLIHGEVGFEAKPLTCRMYPYLLRPTFGRVRAGLLFSCPAVVADEGPPLRSQAAVLERLLEETERIFPPPPAVEETAFDAERPLSVRDLRFLEEALCEALADEELPFLRRVLYAGEILDRLEAASAEVFDPKAFHDALAHVRRKARDEALHGGVARPDPGFFERLLLRQFQGVCSSLAVTRLVAESFAVRQGARLRRLRLALGYLVGGGRMPEGPARFEAAWRVRCLHLPAASEALLARFMGNHFFTRSYFGDAGGGMPVLHGARMALLLPSLALWHAKALAAAAGRDAVAEEDVRGGVLLVAHAFGHGGQVQAGISRGALRLVSLAGWPQRAYLYTAVPA